ncbi:MAG: BamA/TamA family outer membrane protein [Bacteroidota bacterium]
MFLIRKLTYFSLIVLILFTSCNISKNVPKGKYLLKRNRLELDYGTIDSTRESPSIAISGLINETNITKDELVILLRPQPNYRSLGFRLKLRVYNLIDSAVVAKNKAKKIKKINLKNKKRKEKEKEINTKRFKKAMAKGHEYYTEKIIDSLVPKLGFKEFLKYKYGEKPIIFDSLLMKKSTEQIRNYLRKKGYYFSDITATVKYNKEAQINYKVNTGPILKIDAIYYENKTGSYVSVLNSFIKDYIQTEKEHPLIGKPFDSFYLDEIRSKIAKKFKDLSYYGFTSSSLSYIADTNLRTNTVKLGINISNRIISKEDGNIISTEYRIYKIRNVFFHLCDTVHISNFSSEIAKKGLQLNDPILSQFVNTIDTIRYNQIYLSNSKKKQKEKDEKIVLQGKVLDPFRDIFVTYNGKSPSIRPSFLELQNYLEKSNVYKEYYLERTYKSLVQSGLFNSIKPHLIEIKNKNELDVHYYLVPAEKQIFRFEPRFKNSNGFLGLSASVNYTNKNLFRGNQKLTISFGGGFESQPPVFDRTESGNDIQTSSRSFNTFEIGPSLKLEIPGLFPVSITKLSKRQKPQTMITMAYNLQKRDIFDREIFQLNYSWKFIENKWQLFQFGLPFASSIKYVLFNPSDYFSSKINQLNDPFLKNTYSNQFIWQDFMLFYELNNQNRKQADRKTQDNIYFSSALDLVGNTPWLFRSNQQLNTENQYQIFGLGYSQFFRIANDFIYSHKINVKSSLHGRLQAGYGLPYGNSSTSLPYDYSFFAGGANDNRGWKARSLGPGVYKYYLDTNRTITQVADIRLGISVEYRFNITKTLKSCLFLDAGNIWTNKTDPKREGGEFTSNFYKQIAFAAGTGIRIDLSFFIVRFDIGFPLFNPVFPAGSQWFFQANTNYIDEAMLKFYGPEPINGYTDQQKDYVLDILPKRFFPAIHFGLGFPF